MKIPLPAPPAACAVRRLVPFVHVADVDASVAFYASLGFRTDNTLRGPDGRAFWAMLNARPTGSPTEAEIMFARSRGPIAHDEQAVLFYLYSEDVAALREHLLACGLADGGRYCGQPEDTRRIVFDVSHPDHMPDGEIRVHDPDGYCILVGQLEKD